MKILHFSSAKTWRGGEQQIAYLQEALAKKGILQWIFCPKESALARHCQQKKIAHFTYSKIFSTNPFVALQFKKLCDRLQVDLVHLHDSHSHSFAFISTFLGNKVPFVLSRRVDFPVKNSWLSLKKYNHISIKKIISVSNYVQNILAPAISNKNKLTVVHSGIDLERFNLTNQHILRSTFQIQKDIRIIANVAAIAPHKDYFTFVDTAEILLKNNPQLVFLIVGADGGEQASIKKYIAQKRLATNILLLGFREDIPSILPEVDIFLFTSQEEGLGTSIIDAMTCGVPVVATKAGGIPEIIQHKKNGLLAPIKNAEELARQVEKLLFNERLRKEIIEAGKKISRQFSKEQMAQKTLAIYQEIVS